MGYLVAGLLLLAICLTWLWTPADAGSSATRRHAQHLPPPTRDPVISISGEVLFASRVGPTTVALDCLLGAVQESPGKEGTGQDRAGRKGAPDGEESHPAVLEPVHVRASGPAIPNASLEEVVLRWIRGGQRVFVEMAGRRDPAIQGGLRARLTEGRSTVVLDVEEPSRLVARIPGARVPQQG